MGTNYYLYARKSSESEERQVMSIEAQLVELKEYALREKINIVEIFTESKSAKDPGRSEFNKMINKIQMNKQPVGVLAWHPDRLARNSVDGGQIVYLIDTMQIAALRFPTFWFEPTPQGKFMLQVAFGQSKYYSDNLSENIKRGIRHKIRRGEWLGKAPLGYLNNPKTRNIEPDPVKSKIIKQLFKNYADGKYSLNGAREQLQLWGVESKNRTQLSLSTTAWLLSNPLYYGVINHKGEFHQGNFEPLISPELFQRVQKRLKERSQPRKSKIRHDFGFMGLLKCGECGCAITAQFAKGNGGTYRYYRCTKKKGKCSQSYLREDLMLSQLQEELQKFALPENWASEIRAQIDLWEQSEQQELALFVQNLEKAIKDNEAKLDKLINAFLEGHIEKDIYLRKKEALITEKQSLQQKKVRSGQKGLLWLEPLRNWVEVSESAGKEESLKDFSKIKSILEKSGTNRVLKDKKICFDLVEPYQNLRENKAAAASIICKETKNKKGRSADDANLPIWWRLSESNR